MNPALQFKALKYKIFWTQALVTCILVVGGWFYEGLNISLSLLLGGLISIVPSCVFASFYPSHLANMQPESIVKRLYWGEAVKWLVTVLLFTLALQWSDLQVLYVFINFIVMQFVLIIGSSRAS